MDVEDNEDELESFTGIVLADFKEDRKNNYHSDDFQALGISVYL
jgi:hypothetical protein